MQEIQSTRLDFESEDIVPLPAGDFEIPRTWLLQEDLKGDVYGDLHPDKRLFAKKVSWSDDELDWIENWIANQLAVFADLEKPTAVWRCLQHLKLCPDARKIFHRNHVCTTLKLRSGFESLEKRTRERMR